MTQAMGRAMWCGLACLALGSTSCANDANVDDTGTSNAGVTFATNPPTIPATIASTIPTTSVPPTAPPTAPPTTASAARVATTTTVASPPAAALVQFADIDAVDLATRPGSPTLYVAQQRGVVLAIEPNSGEERTALDITDLTDSGGERGLLGIAFAPSAQHVYVNYTDTRGDTVIDQFDVSTDGTIDRDTRRTILTIDQPYANHNGGDLTFGPDGMLYIGTGDGGAGGDPDRYALNPTSLLGKMLRIDPTPDASTPYAVPPDNPFVTDADVRPEIWSFGLRNPWRFSFDITGDLWIGDVGQGNWEEISVGWADDTGRNAGRGLNFGWSAWEGNHRFNDDQPGESHTPPIFEYSHAEGCSVSGGTVYRGAALPALVGWYVFSDYCDGRIRALKIDNRQVVDSVSLGQVANVANVAAGADGELYVLTTTGPLYRVGS